jgi:hypothetical protein
MEELDNPITEYSLFENPSPNYSCVNFIPFFRRPVVSVRIIHGYEVSAPQTLWNNPKLVEKVKTSLVKLPKVYKQYCLVSRSLAATLPHITSRRPS